MTDPSPLQDLGLQMIRLRHRQHLINEALKARAFSIPIHLGFGYEALVAAVDRVAGPDDQITLSHRNAAYNLVRTPSFKAVIDEYRSRGDGLRGGLAGSMNLTNATGGIPYASSILGNNFSFATGLALAKRHGGTPGVVWCFTGDGAIEEGAFWESLVFSKSHALPLVIVVEDNDSSMSSTIEERRCPIDFEMLAGSVGCRFQRLSGNDVAPYVSALSTLRDSARQTGPVLVHVDITMFNQHHGPTPGWPTDPLNISYDNGLIIEDTDRDPIFALKTALGETAFDAIEQDVRAAEPELPA